MTEEPKPNAVVNMPKPVTVADNAVARLFSQGLRENRELGYLQIIGEAREAIAQMPADKKRYCIRFWG